MAPRFATVPGRWLDPESGLTAADRLTLTVLCWHANKEDECWPSISRLSSCTKLGENTIRTSIKRLAEIGVLIVRRRTDEKGDPATNLYTVMGYDPPKGGTSNQRVPVPQIGGEGTSNEQVEVPQIRHPNVVKENNVVNSAASDDSANASSERLKDRAYIGPRDLYDRPIAELPPTEPITEDLRQSWRGALQAVGAGPRERIKPPAGA